MNQLTGRCIMINKYISRVIPRDVVRSQSISLVVVPEIGTGDAAIPYLLTFTKARNHVEFFNNRMVFYLF